MLAAEKPYDQGQTEENTSLQCDRGECRRGAGLPWAATEALEGYFGG